MKQTNRETEDGHRTVSRRALMMGGAQVAFAAALGLRLRYMQVDQADQFRLLAEENRINIRLIPPARGEIYDRNGSVIAQNVPSYRIVIVPEDAGDVDAVLTKLGALIPLDPEDIERARKEMKDTAPFLPVTLTDQATWDDVSRVAVNAPSLPGVSPEVGLTRVYPMGSDFAHVVGYVGRVSQRDLDRIDAPDQLLRIPRFQIGKIGVESKYEDTLRGSAGSKRVEINATGRVMRELDRREGQSGADLQLTVDARLQRYVQARLEGESASAVVIDCEHGDVMAICSSPSYDPNLFVRGISHNDYNALTENKSRTVGSTAGNAQATVGSICKTRSSNPAMCTTTIWR